MSSRRSRSGGRRSSTVLRRNNRSCRNFPAADSAWMSAFVAEMTRTFTRCVLEEPTRSNSPVSSTRSSFACCGKGRFAISSRNSVPPSASSNRPTRSTFASMKAPFTCPNSSLSNRPSGMPPRFTATSGRSARPEAACSQRATTSLPVPCSPRMSTLASDGPMRSISLSTGCIAGDSAISSGRPSRRSARFSLELLAAPQRPAQLDLGAERREQPAIVPRLLDEVARAATHRLDGAVDTGPGGHHDDRRRRVEPLESREQVQPFRPGGRVARVVHVDQEGVEIALVESGKDGAGGSGALDLVALALEEELESFQDVLLIVGDEDAGGGGRGGHGRSLWGL